MIQVHTMKSYTGFLSPTVLTTVALSALSLLQQWNLPNGVVVVDAFAFSAVVNYHPSRTTPTTTATTTTTALSMSTSSSSEKTADFSSSSLTLFGHPGTRSPLVNWACFELGIDFTMGDLSKNPHPFKKIPCLTDDAGQTIVFESGAILEYLMDTYADNNNKNALTKSQKAAITSWIVWANASLDPVCFIETPQGKVYDTGLRKSPNGQPLIDSLDQLLSKQQFLVKVDGNNNNNEDQFTTHSVFTTADVAVASYLLYVPQFFPDADISQWPNVTRYMKDCVEREAYGKAFGEQTQRFLSQRLETLLDETNSAEGSVLDSIRGMFK
mmetsp:Transcript_24828/g.58926  ORF Transcript_24828/g.58926 Transcript_24828/m.58926 type:complete len:326 (+) Transcript_24828:23-1000(+)